MYKILLALMLLLVSFIKTGAQDVFAVKKWKGRYPTMNNDYPLSFVCWKGWLPPVPHFFVRIYPTHYYYYLNSMPVYDVKGYVDQTLYQGLKLVLKELDRKTISKTLGEITGIQINQLGQEAIERLLRVSRLMELPDVMGNRDALMMIVDYLDDASMPVWLNNLFERELRFRQEALLMINGMDCSQGDKLRAEEQISRELRELNGTMLYASQKIRYWQQKGQMKESHLDFLAR